MRIQTVSFAVDFAEIMLKDPLVVESNRLLFSESALKVTS